MFSTHGVAGLTGGLLVGILANPQMLQYIGTDKEAPGINVTGWLYGNAPRLLLQAEGAAFIIVYNIIATLSDAEGGRRRGSRRDGLCDRRRGRVVDLAQRRGTDRLP